MLWRYPAVAANYVSVCAQAEHFLEFRQIVRDNIEAQLQAYLDAKQAKEEKTNEFNGFCSLSFCNLTDVTEI